MAFPDFPVELLEAIIFSAWAQPQTIQERITFMTSSFLVSKTWMKAFMRISSKDVFIPTPRYADHFIRLLDGQSIIYKIDPEIEAFRSFLIKGSLSVRISASNADPEIPTLHPMGLTLQKTLRSVCIGYFPMIRRVCVEFEDRDLDDTTDLLCLSELPPCFTELELRYTYTSLNKRFKAETRECPKDSMHWDFLYVRHLIIMGASKGMVLDFVDRCPNLESVVTDNPDVGKLQHWKPKRLALSFCKRTWRELFGGRKAVS